MRLKNHQPRLREVAWVVLNSENPICQASIPALLVGQVIRHAGIGGVQAMSGNGFVLAIDLCMMMIEVEQRAGEASRETLAQRKMSLSWGFDSNA